MKKVLLFSVFLMCSFSSIVYAETLRSGRTYVIRSAMDENYVIDVYYGLRQEMRGKNVQLYHYHGGDNQQFKILSAGSNWYKIINVKTNKAVDVAGGIAGDEVNVQLWEQNGTDAQCFRFEDAGNGYLYIKNKLGYYLDVYWGVCRDEQNIQTCRKNGGNNQKWKFTYAGGSSMQDDYESTLSYETVTLGSFSTFDEWREQMRKAQSNVIGYQGITEYYDAPSGTTKTLIGGKVIVKINVLKYKTIEVKLPAPGPGAYKKVSLKFPQKVKFTIHEHKLKHNNVTITHDLQSLRLSTTCSCGFKSAFEWHIPWDALAPQKITGGMNVKPIFIDTPY